MSGLLSFLYFFFCEDKSVDGITQGTIKEAINHAKTGNKFAGKEWIKVPNGFVSNDPLSAKC